MNRLWAFTKKLLTPGAADLGWYLRQRPNLPRCRLVALAHMFHSGGRFRTSYIDGMPAGIPSLAEQQASYEDKVRAIGAKLAKGVKVRALYVVSTESIFAMRRMFELMLNDTRFDAKILVTPYPERPDDMSTLESLGAAFGNEAVLSPRGPDGAWRDPADLADIVFYSSPYEAVTPSHSISRALTADFLPVLASYGYPRSEYDNRLFAMDSYAICWKVLLENEQNLAEYRRHSAIGGANAIVTGYVKMDEYASAAEKWNRRDAKNGNATVRRKCVLIAPHHTVRGSFNHVLELSNFLRYAEELIALPNKYPDVDFIFRPHPALFPTLLKRGIWPKTKVDDWRNRMSANANVRFSEGGDFMRDFADSDAMIDDCGSFLVDYFYTGKPQCYLLKSPKDLQRRFTAFGCDCLAHCTLAYDFHDVMRFMNETVIGGADEGAAARRRFAAERIMINYPHSADAALDHILDSLNA